MNVGSGGGAPAAGGGAPAGGAAAGGAAEAVEEKKEGTFKIHPGLDDTHAGRSSADGEKQRKKRRSRTRTWASVFSTKRISIANKNPLSHVLKSPTMRVLSGLENGVHVLFDAGRIANANVWCTNFSFGQRHRIASSLRLSAPCTPAPAQSRKICKVNRRPRVVHRRKSPRRYQVLKYILLCIRTYAIHRPWTKGPQTNYWQRHLQLQGNCLTQTRYQ